MTQSLRDAIVIGGRWEVHAVRTTIRNRNADRGRWDVQGILRTVHIFWQFALALVRVRPDSVYLPLSQNLTGFLRDAGLILLAKGFRRPVAGHLHGGNFHVFMDSLPPWLQTFAKQVLRCVNRIMVLGPSIASDLARLYPQERIRVVYNGIPLKSWRTQLGSGGLGFRAPHRVQLLFMGALAQSKGFHVFLGVAETLLKGYPTLHMVCVGERIPIERNVLATIDGKTFDNHQEIGIEECLQRLKGGDGRFILLPTALGEQKIELFRRSEILVLPSFSEGFPVVVLEAMASGLALVLTPVGAMKDVLIEGHNVFFVEPGNREQTEQAIKRLLDDPALRHRMGENNRKDVTRFDIQTTTRAVTQTLAELLPRPYSLPAPSGYPAHG